MTELEKVALRYQFVTEKLSGASGDFIRTQDSWANQTRILKLQIESLKAIIGQGLINVLNPLLKMLNALLEKLKVVANAFKSFTESFFGKSSSGGSGAGNKYVDTAEGITGGLGSNRQTMVAKLYLDGKQITEAVVREGEIQQMATGNNIFLLGTI